MSFDVSHPEILDAVYRALAEDIGTGDVTTELCVAEESQSLGRMIARHELVVAGVELVPLVFPYCGVEILHPSGSRVVPGTIIAEVQGKSRDLLTGERTALNFVQRLSGIATLAAAYVAETAGTKCKILDTRKTTPGLRRLEKQACAAGGVVNHRHGLYDGILIKNNHITAAGGVRQALERTRDTHLRVEIEVRTLEELDEALQCGAQHLLLDNLTPGEAHVWVQRVAGRATTELSGGITLGSIKAYAASGADFISVGALTHSSPAADLNFRLSAPYTG